MPRPPSCSDPPPRLPSSSTVTDRTCGFPTNILGCDNAAARDVGVRFLTEDLNIECQGVDDYHCDKRGVAFIGAGRMASLLNRVRA